MKLFIVGNNEHQPEDRRCLECYRGYPMKCLCGGFIHAQFMKETWDNQTQLTYSCDKCGPDFKFPEHGRKPTKFKRRKFNNRK